MFWRERERVSTRTREQNGSPPCGQVRVVVVGDAGVGKTSLVHLILQDSSIAKSSQTVCYTVGVKGMNVIRIVKRFSMHKLMLWHLANVGLHVLCFAQVWHHELMQKQHSLLHPCCIVRADCMSLLAFPCSSTRSMLFYFTLFDFPGNNSSELGGQILISIQMNHMGNQDSQTKFVETVSEDLESLQRKQQDSCGKVKLQLFSIR